MTEDIETIKAIASDSKARIDRIVDNYEELEKGNAELKAQIDQLSNDNHVLKTSFITQQEQIKNLEEDKGQIIFESDLKIKALEEMIEKMKNVGNCKHSITCAEWNEKQCNLGLMKFCLNCKEWELAEWRNRLKSMQEYR